MFIVQHMFFVVSKKNNQSKPPVLLVDLLEKYDSWHRWMFWGSQHCVNISFTAIVALTALIL